MSTHNIGFYEDLTNIIVELSSNIPLISSADSHVHIFTDFTVCYSFRCSSLVTRLIDHSIFSLLDLCCSPDSLQTRAASLHNSYGHVIRMLQSYDLGHVTGFTLPLGQKHAGN